MKSILLILMLLVVGCGREPRPIKAFPPVPAASWDPSVQEKAKSCPAGTKMGCLPMQTCQCYPNDYKWPDQN